jgi:membrane-bound lytic murein transglycosylase A
VEAPPPKIEAPAPPVTVEPKPPPPVTEVPPKPAPVQALFRQVAWTDLPGWRVDNVAEAWSAFLASCKVLGAREHWRDACGAASGARIAGAEAARRFFERNFTPYQVSSSEAGDEGLITGYYEPLLRGSREPTDRYRFPLYGVPDDLVVVELAEVYPELKGMRLRGRLEGRRLVPYPDRGRISSGDAQLHGKELVWVDDPIDLFFLQIQGSGRIVLDTGETMRVGYADQNGHPYRSIGRLLVERGDLPLEAASMQGIKAWARANPGQLDELLNSNASYVFFRELPAATDGPPGALGVSLTARRSIAVDPRHVPLGAPVFISTTWPNTSRALNRLMVAQDTGGAIRGPVRADFFWGHGEAASREAGRMKQRLRMWVLLPRGHP